MDETVPPRHVDDDIGASHLVINVLITGEQIDGDFFCAVIHAIQSQIQCFDRESTFQQSGHDMPTDVAARARDKYSLTHDS